MSIFKDTFSKLWGGVKNVVGAVGKAIFGGGDEGVTVVIQPPVVIETEESIERGKTSMPQLAGIDTNIILLIGLPVILYFMLRKK